MDYKQKVITGADQRYQDMLAGKTPPIIGTDLGLKSSAPYAANRDRFVKRAEQERKDFNSAIDEVKRNRQKRLGDKSSFVGVVVTAVIFIVLMAVIMGAYLAVEDFSTWVVQDLPNFTGKTFGEAFNMDNPGMATVICLVVAIIAMVVAFIWGMIAMDIDGCIAKLIASELVAALIALAVFFVLRILIFLGGYGLFYLLQPLGALILGVAAVVIILIVGRNLLSSKYKTQKWIYCAVCLAVSLIVMLVIS